MPLFWNPKILEFWFFINSISCFYTIWRVIKNKRNGLYLRIVSGIQVHHFRYIIYEDELWISFLDDLSGFTCDLHISCFAPGTFYLSWPIPIFHISCSALGASGWCWLTPWLHISCSALGASGWCWLTPWLHISCSALGASGWCWLTPWLHISCSALGTSGWT